MALRKENIQLETAFRFMQYEGAVRTYFSLGVLFEILRFMAQFFLFIISLVLVLYCLLGVFFSGRKIGQKMLLINLIFVFAESNLDSL